MAEAPLAVGNRAPDQGGDIFNRQRTQCEQLAARQQCAVDREVRVAGGRPHQRQRSRLDIGQQRILLGPIEAMDFVDEQQR